MVTLAEIWREDETWEKEAFIQNPHNKTSFKWLGEQYTISPIVKYDDMQALCADKDIFNLQQAFIIRLAVDLTNPDEPQITELKEAPKPIREELHRRYVNMVHYRDDFDALTEDEQKLFTEEEKAKIAENTKLRDEAWNAAISTEKERLQLVEKYNNLMQLIINADIGDDKILVWNAQYQVLKEVLGLD